jgi:MoxR-like ATPase
VEIVQGATVRTLAGQQHKQFARFVKALATKNNVWLAGPAGSGKTTAAEKAAEALGVPFYFNGAIDTEYKLLGFIDAQGRIVSTAFREAFTNGGVYLFDEVDASLPAATLAFQAALANGMADFPGGMVRRHPDFYCVAAANTWGLGATNDYVGRNRLDAAFLDRFVVKISWGYDESLERTIAGNDEWTSFVQGVRAKAKANGLKVVISPRASIGGALLLAAGFTMEETADLTVYASLTADQRANLGA